jgi:large subunit ribosomal protein L6
MARIAKKPIEIPQGVKIKTDGGKVLVEGPKGSLNHELMPGLKLDVKEKTLFVLPIENAEVEAKALNASHGLTHALIKNMLRGVSVGFEKKLEIQGVGYRAALDKGKLTLSLGFSHPIIMELPKGITIDIEKQTFLTIKGVDKYLVGEMTAKIRRVKPPEVYKGTGIRYLGEYVRKKVGKTGATGKAGAK